MTNPWLYVVYALGYSTGNYIGMCIEEKLSIGKVMIRIITQKDSKQLIEKLKEKNYNLTIVNGTGKRGKVKLIFSVIDKKELKKVIGIINATNPKSFYSIEDVRYAQDNDLLYDKTFSERSKYNLKRR